MLYNQNLWTLSILCSTDLNTEQPTVSAVSESARPSPFMPQIRSEKVIDERLNVMHENKTTIVQAIQHF